MSSEYDSHSVDDSYFESHNDENFMPTGDEYAETFDLFQEPDFAASTEASVEEATYSVMSAALNTNMPVKQARQLLLQLRDAATVFNALKSGGFDTAPITKAIDHALARTGDIEYGNVDMRELGLLDRVSVDNDALTCLVRVSTTTPAENPIRSWRKPSTMPAVTGLIKSATLSALIQSGSAPSELREAYKAVVSSSPVSLDEGGVQAKNPTARETLAESADDSLNGVVTMSSVFASLIKRRLAMAKRSVTSVYVFVAPSGSGKTSAFNTIVPAGVQDIVNQGHRGKTVYVHVEDDTKDLFDNMGISPEGPYQGLMDHMVLTKTTSREEVVKLVYREVREAHQRSVSEGLPIQLLVPPAIFIDYFQALTAPMDGGLEVTSARTADLLLHGFANFDADAMAKYGGIGYEEYTGEAWPAGLEQQRCAWLQPLSLGGTGSEAV